VLLGQSDAGAHVANGNPGFGYSTIMLAYWVLQAVNIALMSVMVGFVTYPLTLLAFLVACPTNVLESRSR